MVRYASHVTPSCRLHVEGSPGGLIYLRDGRVIAATTPASPGPESLLIRSGRVSEPAWSAAFSAGAPAGRVGAELVARGGVGVAGLETVCLLATFDALFAMALSGVRPAAMEPLSTGDLLPPLLVLPGIPVDRVDRETARRLEIASGWRAAGVTAQCRPLAVRPASGSALRADALRESVLARARGRLTARDIAFSLGQGLFVVMREIAHLAREGLLDPSPPVASPSGDDSTLGEAAPRLPLLPRHAATGDGSAAGQD
jgi:hypothetical protein